MILKPIKVKIKDLNKFQKSHDILEVIDHYNVLLSEVFEILNIHITDNKEYNNKFNKFKKKNEHGQWFYFPWRKTLIQYLPESLHMELLTARNKTIISKKEQKQLYESTIGIAGLSVGSHAALTLAMMGIAQNIKLADPDIVSGSNLNRLHLDFTQIGKSKVEVISELIYQRNPYVKIETFDKGLNDRNIDKFLTRLDLLIEETDNIKTKIAIREKARKARTPVIMATDTGDGVILDVERFDQNKKYPIFHNRVKISNNNLIEASRKRDPKFWNQLASKIIGTEFMEEEHQKSLLDMGTKTLSVPQLATAATLSGSILTTATKRILLGKPLKSGKYVFSPITTIDPNYNNQISIRNRELALNNLNHFLSI